jgi:hypothetical protein
MRLAAFVLGTAAGAYAGFVRPWMMRWGSTHEERSRALPGDEIVRDANRVTRAITIDAPPGAVWPWLVQMGQDRAGFYSHDRLERLFGADIHNADDLVPDWQQLEVGDLMRTYRVVRRFEPLGWFVAALERERLLILREKEREGRVNSAWTLFLEPVAGGRTRLLSRWNERVRWPQLPFRLFLYEPAHFIMETGVLLGLKKRAESHAKDPTNRRVVGTAGTGVR